MTFAPRVRTYNNPAPKQKGTHAGRTGVTVVGEGRNRIAVATIRQGNSLVFLGSGSVEHCTKLFDEAKDKQQSQLRAQEKMIRHGINYSSGNPYHG